MPEPVTGGNRPRDEPAPATALTLFLAGDVMTGRGIDQVLPASVDPRLYEPYVKDATRYVQLAEAESGEIPAPVPYDSVWGDALGELDRTGPAARILNLETAVTADGEPWRGKGIHYRMHPANVPLLEAAGVDVCSLANNHVMDWGRAGLEDTLRSLRERGLATTGAGSDLAAARRPAVVETAAGRVLVFAWASPDAGVPRDWAASAGVSGVNLLTSLGRDGSDGVAEAVEVHRRSGDRVVVSLHWGPNWGYDVPRAQRSFAHRLVDAGAADVVFGHSSHHPKGIEVYRGRLIVYGAGDFLNDYEGIGGREEYRGELALMYFPTLAASGGLTGLRLVPMRIRRFRLERPPPQDAAWLAETLDRHGQELGTWVDRVDGDLHVRWS